MSCHLAATRGLSRRDRSSLAGRSPPISPHLDLSRPNERAAHDLLWRLSTARWPRWRVLALRRRGPCLLVAVEWRRERESPRYSRIKLTLAPLGLHWRDFVTAEAARRSVRR